MDESAAVLTAEQEFFDALRSGDYRALDRLLTDDFMIVDIMSGSQILKPIFIDAVTSGMVTFEKIDRVDTSVRFYGIVAIVVGRTEMAGKFQGQPFAASSRYTHVFVQDSGAWRLAAAQGTQISDGSELPGS